ncbi:MAG TPA: carbamate kinase [Hyphomicrobiaceae bacterium]|nr:carbamate kinase [Hyphomicrobiaceae bacterium]
MAQKFEVPKRVVIAIGGNATHPENISGTSAEQKVIAKQTADALLELALHEDTELIITHGNGPVVGKILMRQALTRDRIPPMTLDICVAHSQGGIAYLLMQALENALREADSQRHVACLLTQVEVDHADPAFKNPTKYVGPFFTKENAEAVGRELGWNMKEDGARGWRHVVPSPIPKHICDISLIEVLSKRGTVVIAGGGGGIPVVRGPKGVRNGIEAVIDKDLTTQLMAKVLGIDTIVLLTAVPKIAVNFGKPEQRFLDRVTLSELKKLHAEGHFPPGSMGPKIEAAIRFLDGGGKRVVIARLTDAVPALKGETGTQIVRDGV